MNELPAQLVNKSTGDQPLELRITFPTELLGEPIAPEQVVARLELPTPEKVVVDLGGGVAVVEPGKPWVITFTETVYDFSIGSGRQSPQIPELPSPARSETEE